MSELLEVQRKRTRKHTPSQERCRRCEVCRLLLPPGEYPVGCERCGRVYGMCCNSPHPDLCVDCAGVV